MLLDGAGHSTHDLDGLMAWFARDAVPPPVVAGIKVPVMILSGALDQVSQLNEIAQPFRVQSDGLFPGIAARCRRDLARRTDWW